MFSFFFLSLYVYPKYPKLQHQASRVLHSMWNCIEWWSGDRRQLTCDSWHMTEDSWNLTDFFFFFQTFRYQCYYPHTLRNLVSHVFTILIYCPFTGCNKAFDRAFCVYFMRNSIWQKKPKKHVLASAVQVLGFAREVLFIWPWCDT